ncbi:MAG: hypothetical protein AAGJ18_03790 [Bacteroidota bacterium]
MNRFLFFVLLGMLGVGEIACHTPNNKPVTTNFDEAAFIDWFNSFNPQWSEAVRNKNPRYIIDRYAEDAIIGAPDKPFVIGKVAIEAYWQNLVLFMDDFAYETQYIGGDPEDILFENGRAFVTYTLEGRQQTDTTKYLFVWQHIGNREYRVLSEMFNAK